MTALTLAGLIMAACTGTIAMSPLDPTIIKADYAKNTDVEGIIVYRAIPRVQVEKFIQVNLPPAGTGLPPTLSDNCDHVVTRKIVSIADWEHPYRLHYKRAFLEAYTFAATLNGDGVLLSINTVSTPDQGKTFQNLASAASTAAAIAARDALKPPCTITPVFVGYEELPRQAQIGQYNTLCQVNMPCP